MNNVKDMKQHKLEQLAAEVNRLAGELEEIDRLYESRPVLWHSIGTTLIAMKTTLGHGAWVNYIAANITLSDRQCRSYVRFVKLYPDLKTAVNRQFTSLDVAIESAETTARHKAKLEKIKAQREADLEAARVLREQVLKEEAEFKAEFGEQAWHDKVEEDFQNTATDEEKAAHKRWSNDWRVNGSHVHPPSYDPAILRAYAALELYPVSEDVLTVVYKYLAFKHHPAKFKEGSPEQDDAGERLKEINHARDVLKPTTERK